MLCAFTISGIKKTKQMAGRITLIIFYLDDKPMINEFRGINVAPKAYINLRK